MLRSLGVIMLESVTNRDLIVCSSSLEKTWRCVYFIDLVKVLTQEFSGYQTALNFVLWVSSSSKYWILDRVTVACSSNRIFFPKYKLINFFSPIALFSLTLYWYCGENKPVNHALIAIGRKTADIIPSDIDKACGVEEAEKCVKTIIYKSKSEVVNPFNCSVKHRLRQGWLTCPALGGWHGWTCG